MRCSACGADIVVENVFPGARVPCSACGASVVVPLVVDPPAAAIVMAATAPVVEDAPCPRCQAALVVRDEAGVVVAACPLGHGLFVTHRVLNELVGSPSPAVELAVGADGAHTVPERLRCPRCKAPMTPREIYRTSRVVIDVCDEHGTWFDAGELAAAVAEPAAPHQDPPADGHPDDLQRRAAATIDVALALEQAHETETVRHAVDLADDVLDTFNHIVLGRTRTVGRRYR